MISHGNDPSNIVYVLVWRAHCRTVRTDGSIAPDENVPLLIEGVMTPPSVRGVSYVNITTHDNAHIDGPNPYQVPAIVPGLISPSADGIHVNVDSPGVVGSRGKSTSVFFMALLLAATVSSSLWRRDSASDAFARAVSTACCCPASTPRSSSRSCQASTNSFCLA